MKIRFGLISLVTAALLMTGCNDTGDTNVTITEPDSYTIEGDVNGCVVASTSVDSLFEGENIDLSGVKVSVGNQSAITGEDGCFSIDDVTITELNTITTSDTSTTFTANFEKDGYDDTSQVITVTNTVVGGVLATLVEQTMIASDIASPEIVSLSVYQVQAGIMLIVGVDGLVNPIIVDMSENVTLANGLNDGIVITQTVDANGTVVDNPVALSTTVTTSFNATDNELSISTSDALEAGAVYDIAVPVQQVMDIQTNYLVDNGFTDASTDADGIDFVSFDVMIFSQSNNEAEAPTNLVQMVEDINSLKEDSLGLQEARTANETFSNVAKDEPNNVYMYNKSNLLGAEESVDNLLNEILVDDGVVYDVIQNAARIQFTPSNAAYYEVSAIRTDTNATVTNLVSIGLLNATATDNNTTIKVEADGTDAVELVMTNLPVDADSLPVEVKVIVTPYSFSDVNGTVAELTLGDNVKPTTSLQYSYNTDDGTDSTYSPGVISADVIEAIYGGSGELANATSDEQNTSTSTVYTIGTPYLELTIGLLQDQNGTDVSPISLPANYTASDYATFSADLSRSFGVGFTEAINVSVATLDGSSSALIDSVTNTENNEMVTGTAGDENIAVVSTTNIMTLANENNASILSFTNAVDLSGNAADKAEVVLVDKVPPFVVSADINASDVNASSVTFSENIKAGSIDIGPATCIINDMWISGKVVQLDGCVGIVQNASTTVDFSLMPDENDNTNNNFTFDANVTN